MAKKVARPELLVIGAGWGRSRGRTKKGLGFRVGFRV